MLGAIRDKASGWIAGIIVGALILSFAFWGVSFYAGQGEDVNVATVNGTDIKLRSFQRSFSALSQQMQSLLEDDTLALEEELVKQETMKRLIETEIVNQIVEDAGLRITDARLIEIIKNLAYFKNDKGFDRDKYERAVMSVGMAPLDFEEQLRMDLLSEQLQAGLSESIFVLETELDEVIQLQSQKRDLTYSILNLTAFIDEGDIDEAEIEAFYKAHPQKFSDPEKVKIEYIDLNVDELAKTVITDETLLRTYYSDNKDTYDVVEQRSVTRLFVKVDEQATAEDKAKASAVINEAMALVTAGKTFTEVIAQFTDEGKGSLEFSEHAFVTKGIMDKEVDEFLFSAEEGAISAPIETKSSFCIVKVGEIRGGPKNVFESVAEQVEQDYKKSEAELQFFELADQLTTLSYEHSDTLEIAAEAIGKQVVGSDFFSRESVLEGILANAKIISTSFDPELMSTGQNSEVVELTDNHIVVLRVVDYKVATTKPLAEVKDEVLASIRLEQASAKIKVASADITQQLVSGISPDAITSDVDVEWQTIEKVERDDVNVNRAVLRYAFQAGRPEDADNKPIILSKRLGSGDYAIIAITAVYDDEIVADEVVTQEYDLTLRRNRGTAEWVEFIKNARSNADVKIFKDNI